jgi:surface protein
MAIGYKQGWRNTGSGGAEQYWIRPTDWLPMPTVTSSQQTFVGLYAIIENSDNFASLLFTTDSGQYEVDWGDGTVDLVNSNTLAQHEYNFVTYDPTNSTLTTRGYKQAIITVTPVSGDLLTCNFQTRFVTSPVQNQAYSTGFLDCILSMPSASGGSSIIFGGVNATDPTLRHTYIERINFLNIGGCTVLDSLCQAMLSLQDFIISDTSAVTSMRRMFQQCTSLQVLPLFDTRFVTDMSVFCGTAGSLREIPLFDTRSVTNMTQAFSGCPITEIPLLNTSNVTDMSSMFTNCLCLKTIPLFVTSSVSTMSGMFSGCSSLFEIPLLDTRNVTTMERMFFNCVSLQSMPLLNTLNVSTMASMFSTVRSLNSIPALLTSAINVDFGTSFAASSASLNRCEMIFTRTVSFANCQLSATAIEEIFTNLSNRTATTSANINITSNWGATALSAAQKLIATSKNWTITG